MVLHVPAGPPALPGEFLVVATNCNGGVKEVLCFEARPDVDEARTVHWFDPCALLAPDARSELRCEFRRRQRGGGWEPTV